MFNIVFYGLDIFKMGSINKNKVLFMFKESFFYEKCEDGKSEVIFEMFMYYIMKSKFLFFLIL